MTLPAQPQIDWMTPWLELTNDRERALLERELYRELAPGHELSGRAACAIARRQDCDDVLFRLLECPSVAVVHLSYVKTPPEHPPWPSTEVFSTLADFVAQRMVPDHEDFIAGDPR